VLCVARTVVVSFAVGVLWRTFSSRSILARMPSALAVQMNERGLVWWASMNDSMASINSETLRHVRRSNRFVVISRNQRSILFRHELLVGMKCTWNRGCTFSRPALGSKSFRPRTRPRIFRVGRSALFRQIKQLFHEMRIIVGNEQCCRIPICPILPAGRNDKGREVSQARRQLRVLC
jgi:hypothetical protein